LPSSDRESPHRVRRSFYLFGGPLRTRVLAEPLTSTLQVRLQVYRYVAGVARYGVVFGTVTDTGLASMAGFYYLGHRGQER
jgi:hypothetical protein